MIAKLAGQVVSMTRIVKLVGRKADTLIGAAKVAAEALRAGKVIAMPTDTIYGLAAIAQNNEAVSRLYGIKGRDAATPIAVCVARVEDMFSWCHVSVAESVLEELLPGPVTVVFRRKPELNPDFNPDTDLVGIRIPDHDFVRELCRNCGDGLPIALTSANRTSARSTLAITEFAELFPDLEMVFDGGRLSSDSAMARLGSTVVDLSVPGQFSFLRDGCAVQNTRDVLARHGIIERP